MPNFGILARSMLGALRYESVNKTFCVFLWAVSCTFWGYSQNVHPRGNLLLCVVRCRALIAEVKRKQTKSTCAICFVSFDFSFPVCFLLFSSFELSF